MIWLWCARITWALLPVTTGSAFGDALDSWSTGSMRVAAVLLWLVWVIGLLVLFAPRPWGLTYLRVAAPCGVVCTALTITSTSAGAAALASVGVALAAGFALSAPIAAAAGNALAYGDEQRFLLRVPSPLLLGPLPLAIALVGGGAAAGPLIFASGHIVLGVIVTVIGLAVASVVVRSLHALSGRWLVFVPAGVALVDPLTLVAPVLVKRNQILALHRPRDARSPRGADDGEGLDLRLGTWRGSVTIELAEPAEFVRRRGRADSEVRETRVVTVAVTRTDTALALAGARHIPTR